MNVPPNLKYTKDHEWVSSSSTTLTIGITDHAQSQLGDITFVELPKVGTQFKKGQTVGVVESVKAVSDIYSPMTCKITEVNSKAVNQPEIVNKDPYQSGWLLKAEALNSSELEGLLTADQYSKLTQE